MLNFHWQKGLSMLLLAIVLLPMSGCWDRKEIENRGYILGVGIDHVAAPGPKGQFDLAYTPQAAGTRKYRMTVELPKFRKEEGSKEVSSGQSHLIWAAEGESMFAMTRMINTKTYFGMFYEDMQSIVFSESVAREGIRDILDFFQRDSEMRRRVKLFVTPGRAEEVLTAKLQVLVVNSIFIAKLLSNVDKSPYFASKVEMGQIAKAIRNKRSFGLPMVVVEDKEVKLIKSAIFDKHARMVGELTELETIGGKLLRNNLMKGVLIVPNPVDPSKLVAFELYEPSIKVNCRLEDDTLRFMVDATLVGTLGENMEPRQDAYDRLYVSAVEQAVQDEYTHIVRGAYSKLQELKTDAIELGGHVHRQYPHYWEQIKDRWDDEIFPSVPLDISITVIIRRPATMR